MQSFYPEPTRNAVGIARLTRTVFACSRPVGEGEAIVDSPHLLFPPDFWQHARKLEQADIRIDTDLLE